ncbi:MAG: RDD family protein [Nitrosomonas sp.]|nr:RDD family protein [Nitrosomonas sp.]
MTNLPDDTASQTKITVPGFGRRMLALCYEFILLLGIWFVVSLLFHLVFRDPNAPYFRPLFQFYLLSIGGIYFAWFWTHGGQTLAMQTWRMKLISADGRDDRITVQQAVKRYVMAIIGISFFGIGLWWALFDRDRRFLHDRLAHTCIINTVASSKKARETP